ncbi:MAG: PEGA domain-containing protein [Candidatus Eisenbacteria bacterium]|nr:PEGA domain-containing protein [Candidatus Eisenbacteria bacterium]
MRQRSLETRVISCFSNTTGTFALADESGACGFVACAHRELDEESLAWLRRFLAESFAAARLKGDAGQGPDLLVRFFQAVHAGLFGEKQGPAQGIGEVSLAAVRVVGDVIEVAGAGKCAAYTVTAAGVRRLLPTEEGGEDQSGLGTSLKVSMEMVKRGVSDDAVLVLATPGVEGGEAWVESLRQAVRCAQGSASECCEAVFGGGGGGLVVVGSQAALSAVGGRSAAGETDVTWYTTLREDIKRGAGGLLSEELLREDGREEGERQETSPTTGAAGSLAGPEGAVEPGMPSQGTKEPQPEEDANVWEGASRQSAVAAAEQQPYERGTTEGAATMEAAPDAAGRHTLNVPVRSLGVVIAAVAVCVAGYALWSGQGRTLRLFSLGGGRNGEPEGVAANAGMGTLVLGSVPSGAEVVIDDRVISSRTPVSTVPISPGMHEVKLRLGELGEWAGSVSLQPGDTASVNVAFIGGISVSSGAKGGLSVYLDDELKGYTPCLLESIPAGLHVVKVEGEGFSPWQEEVVVTYGGISEVDVKAGKLPTTGQVRVTSRVMTEEGFEDAGGAPVYLDAKRVGTTPAKIDAKPGLHSVKVGGLEGHSASVFVIDVRPGGKHFIRAEFGGGEPVVIDCLETRAPGGELMVYASLVNKREAILSDVSLYLEKSGGTQVRWQPMVLVPGSRGVYASVIPESILSGGGVLKYFARARTSEGMEYYSEVRSVP